MRRRVIAGLLVITGMSAYAGLDLLDRVPGVVSLAPVPTVTVQPPAPPVTTKASPQPTPVAARTFGLSLAARQPTAAALAAALGPVLRDPALASSSVVVRDVATGAVLFSRDPSASRMPASTTKLLSSRLVAQAFTPGETLTTSAVLTSSAGKTGSLVLVAGGDTLLSPGSGTPDAVAGHAGLGDLAAATATALTAKGVSTVTLSADIRYAAGPALAPTWDPTFPRQGIVTPVAMLGLASEREVAGKPSPQNPPLSALNAFAARLGEHGIRASLGAKPFAGQANPTLAPLASVTSAPVEAQLALALTDSDNGLTEVLARQAAWRQLDKPATVDFAAAGKAVVAALAADGIPTAGVALVDASGLSREDRATAATLAELIARSASEPAYRRAIAGMPIAGLTGTLADRFRDDGTRAGAGLVRAKTGTLTGATALAGIVVDRDGRLLAFAALANGVGTLQARAALDRVATVLASCGCR